MKTLLNMILFAVVLPLVLLAMVMPNSEEDRTRERLHPL
jgi:hypothetical protein